MSPHDMDPDTFEFAHDPQGALKRDLMKRWAARGKSAPVARGLASELLDPETGNPVGWTPPPTPAPAITMDPAALVADLQARGVTLEQRGERLIVHPGALVTPSELETLKAHKPAVLAWLHNGMRLTETPAEKPALTGENGTTRTVTPTVEESAETPANGRKPDQGKAKATPFEDPHLTDAPKYAAVLVPTGLARDFAIPTESLRLFLLLRDKANIKTGLAIASADNMATWMGYRGKARRNLVFRRLQPLLAHGYLVVRRRGGRHLGANTYEVRRGPTTLPRERDRFGEGIPKRDGSTHP